MVLDTRLRLWLHVLVRIYRTKIWNFWYVHLMRSRSRGYFQLFNGHSRVLLSLTPLLCNAPVLGMGCVL
jgi:hypothetical protein